MRDKAADRSAGLGRLAGSWRRHQEDKEHRRRQRESERDRESADRLTERLTVRWADLRATGDRPEPVAAGPSNLSRAQVPWGVDLAAAWGWRFLVIAAAGLAILWTLQRFAVLVLPLIIALFLAALAAPLVNRAAAVGFPRKLAALLTVLVGLGLIVLAFTFVSQQVVAGVSSLSDQVVVGLDEVQRWLRTGPLHATDSQINQAIAQAQNLIKEQGKHLTQTAGEVGATLGHVLAGFFIILFATYFFLADGRVIWAWVVRLFPRDARVRTDSSGKVAWRSLTQFVRATVLVAGTDALGIAIWAAVLGLPLVGAIGVLVFLGAFVPMIGATISGTVAVLVALVAKGPIAALVMFAGVVVVQQVEAHVLQPFLMGRFVSVHPLGVIVAIGAGVLLAGVGGALIAVPVVAVVNAVVTHLAAHTRTGEDVVSAAEGDPLGAPEPPAEDEPAAEEAPVPEPEDAAAEPRTGERA